MPFAPRPFQICQYIQATSPNSVLSNLKSLFLDTASPYLPITEYPLCYADNKSILSHLGFEKAIPQLLRDIPQGNSLQTPETDPTGSHDKHFLQAGFFLSEDLHHFSFELSGRMHFIGLVFCRTPEQTIKKLEAMNATSGPWMLDQIIFNEQGRSSNLMYGQNHPTMTAHVSDLLKRIHTVNSSLENNDYTDTTSLFTRLMGEFHEYNKMIMQEADVPKNNYA